VKGIEIFDRGMTCYRSEKVTGLSGPTNGYTEFRINLFKKKYVAPKKALYAP
jgi:hypothetical protein